MILRRFTFVCLLTIVAVCGIALTPNEALSSIAGFLRSGGAGGTGPSVPSITSITPPANGTYTSGTLSFTLNWSSPVNIAGGTPTLPFNTTPTQGVATCATGMNITAQVCTWSVGSNQSANSLATTASGLLLNGATISAVTPFSVSNGKVMGPNGQVFVPHGVDIVDCAASTCSIQVLTAADITTAFPHINFVKIQVENNYPIPSFYTPLVNALTSQGIVVQFTNYNTPGSAFGCTWTAFTGAALTTEVNWYASLATAFIGNPYVWFNTTNEVCDGNNVGSANAEQVAIYNAIRATGSNAIIGIEALGGYSQGQPGYAGLGNLNPASFTSRTNIIWDVHYYNGSLSGFQSNCTLGSALADATALANEIACAQNFTTSASGPIPVIIGEYGNSTDGTNVDAGWVSAVQAVFGQAANSIGSGADVYYYPYAQGGAGATGDQLFNGQPSQTINPPTLANSGLSSYGLQVAAGIATGSGPVFGAIANLTGAISDTFPGIIVNPTGTPTVVTAVSIMPSSGLLTQSGSIGAGNTATVTVTFSGPETVNAIAPNVPTITLSQGTVCSYASGSTTPAISFSCTILSGQDIVLNTVDIRLRTASSGAIALNGGSINNGGVPATLTNASNQIFENVTVDTTTPYFTVVGGSGSTCSWASPCLPAAAQTKARSTLKHIWSLASGGVYSGLATSSVGTNSAGGAYPTAPVYILMTPSDNGQTWIGYPGETVVWDGGCTSAALYNPAPGCVFAPFGGGTGGGTGVTNLTVQYMTFDHFYGAGLYEWYPVNLLVANNVFENFYNTCGNAAGGDGTPCNGAGGAIAIFNLWANVQFLHNTVTNFAGFGTTFNGIGPTSAGTYSLTETIDSNNFVTTCSGITDCGAIYTGIFSSPLTNRSGSTLVTVTNNFIKTVGANISSNGACIYGDINLSAAKIANNICTGAYQWSIEYDVGSNSSATGNIFDLTSIGSDPKGFFWTFVSCSGLFSCVSSINNSIGGSGGNGNIVYNGNSSPPPYLGLGYFSQPFTAPPTMGVNWYRTNGGAFATNFPWGYPGSGGTNNTPTNPSGVSLTSNPFVNAPAQTSAGFQLLPGSVPLSGGFTQIPTNQGPL